jgi:Zn-dependent protease
MRWLYSLLFAIMLFACVALHELGHSYVAHKNGISIKSITLYFFGGVASMEDLPRNPSLELKMAFAGPAVSGVLGIISIYLAGPVAAYGGTGSAPAIMLWTLGIMNVILMAFNLLPAFPMDGGRLLRAWFATRMPYIKATRLAADIGKIFATLMFLLGLSSLNFMLLFVAFFVYAGASEEEKSTEISVSLAGISVRNIMSSPVRSVSQDMTLDELQELMFREKHRGYPVMDGSALVGIITLTDLQKVAEADRAITRVGQVMTRKLYLIGPEQEASTAMKIMNDMQIRRLPVIVEDRLLGIVSREDLVRAIELCREREH